MDTPMEFIISQICGIIVSISIVVSMQAKDIRKVLIGQLICNRIDVANEWGLIYVTTEVSATMCDSSCTACGGTKNCPCTCTDTNCTCCGSHGGGGGGNTGKYTVLYYNYY